ncbi:GNAT family acetyltransferase [Halalkaliarchaeum desulfuricum]|uniref:GNAT family acetyltransferase n=1 Tax=Halalkaliarchaeum desulfuricum TaxID=2055893 RepID=A0A343TJL9_9EURY|nr:GNAT family N-acetyltransferase [Halalkaliarchaeum desulfuricum]AUX09291.1 GNAT family acetyltransferase [Halalkaliarchaeum desulfuricum]
MVSLREASPEDATAMARIQSESLRENADEHYTDEQLAHLAPAEPGAEAIPEDEFTDDSCRPIIAELDGKIVGWGSVHLDENVLAATFVDPDYKRQGVGRTIVEELETIARREGVEVLIVPASLNAVGFYETLGYEKQREIDASGPDTPEIPSIELAKQLS